MSDLCEHEPTRDEKDRPEQARFPTTPRRPMTVMRVLAGLIVVTGIVLGHHQWADPFTTIDSGEASHWALASAFADGQIALGKHVGKLAVDRAVHNGITYSVSPPGNALLIAPLLDLGLDPRWLSSIAFGITLGIVFVWLSSETDTATALAGVAILASSRLLVYSGLLFAHSLSTCLITIAAFTATHDPWRPALFGFALGWAAITEAALTLLVLAGFVLVVVGRRGGLRWYLAACGIPLAMQAGYYWAAFGAPWVTGYQMVESGPWVQYGPGAQMFSGPLQAGLRSFIWQGPDALGWMNHGILARSPVFILALPGTLAYAYDIGWRKALAGLLVVTGYVILYAKDVGFAGGMGDSRYLLPFLPLLTIAVGHFLYVGGRAAWALTVLTYFSTGLTWPWMVSLWER